MCRPSAFKRPHATHASLSGRLPPCFHAFIGYATSLRRSSRRRAAGLPTCARGTSVEHGLDRSLRDLVPRVDAQGLKGTDVVAQQVARPYGDCATELQANRAFQQGRRAEPFTVVKFYLVLSIVTVYHSILVQLRKLLYLSLYNLIVHLVQLEGQDTRQNDIQSNWTQVNCHLYRLPCWKALPSSPTPSKALRSAKR